jgi:hypothetical protein
MDLEPAIKYLAVFGNAMCVLDSIVRR